MNEVATPDWKTNLLPATGFSVDSPSKLRESTFANESKQSSWSIPIYGLKEQGRRSLGMAKEEREKNGETRAEAPKERKWKTPGVQVGIVEWANVACVHSKLPVAFQPGHKVFSVYAIYFSVAFPPANLRTESRFFCLELLLKVKRKNEDKNEIPVRFEAGEDVNSKGRSVMSRSSDDKRLFLSQPFPSHGGAESGKVKVPNPVRNFKLKQFVPPSHSASLPLSIPRTSSTSGAPFPTSRPSPSSGNASRKSRNCDSRLSLSSSGHYGINYSNRYTGSNLLNNSTLVLVITSRLL
ncbi:hypothetical protein V1478_002681, partial [Vespula squamosa]